MPVPGFNIPNFTGLYQPPNYRLPKWLTYIQGLCGGLTWRKAIFDAYRNGDAQAVYDSATTYAADTVVWWNYATYQSLVSGNTGNQPDISPSAWILRCASFIGASERVKYNGFYLYLTWALNRQFGTIFRQPPYPTPYDFGLGGGRFSDIYITTETPTYVSPLLGSEPDPYCYIGSQPTNVVLGSEAVVAAATSYQYVIHFPVTVYTNLGSPDPVRLSIIDNFVKKYLIIGTSYSVTTY